MKPTPSFNARLYDLVVDVGIIPDIGHVIPEKAEIAVDHVEDDIGAGMADMTVVIDRHAADVHFHLAGIQRNEFFLTGRKGIVNSQCHNVLNRR